MVLDYYYFFLKKESNTVKEACIEDQECKIILPWKYQEDYRRLLLIKHHDNGVPEICQFECLNKIVKNNNNNACKGHVPQAENGFRCPWSVQICFFFFAEKKISKDAFGFLAYLFCSTNPLDLSWYGNRDTWQMNDLSTVTRGRNCQTSSNCSPIYFAFRAIIPSRKGISLLGH